MQKGIMFNIVRLLFICSTRKAFIKIHFNFPLFRKMNDVTNVNIAKQHIRANNIATIIVCVFNNSLVFSKTDIPFG